MVVNPWNKTSAHHSAAPGLALVPSFPFLLSFCTFCSAQIVCAHREYKPWPPSLPSFKQDSQCFYCTIFLFILNGWEIVPHATSNDSMHQVETCEAACQLIANALFAINVVVESFTVYVLPASASGKVQRFKSSSQNEVLWSHSYSKKQFGFFFFSSETCNVYATDMAVIIC